MVPADAHPCGDDFRSGALQAVIVDVGERQMAAAPCEEVAIARPIPEAAPVTTAVRPSSFSNVALSF
jgi:hypothetical protein